MPDVIEFYREKVDSLRDQLIAKLNEEKNDVLIDKMEKDVSFSFQKSYFHLK